MLFNVVIKNQVISFFKNFNKSWSLNTHIYKNIRIFVGIVAFKLTCERDKPTEADLWPLWWNPDQIRWAVRSGRGQSTLAKQAWSKENLTSNHLNRILFVWFTGLSVLHCSIGFFWSFLSSSKAITFKLINFIICRFLSERMTRSKKSCLRARWRKRSEKRWRSARLCSRKPNNWNPWSILNDSLKFIQKESNKIKILFYSGSFFLDFRK